MLEKDILCVISSKQVTRKVEKETYRHTAFF